MHSWVVLAEVSILEIFIEPFLKALAGNERPWWEKTLSNKMLFLFDIFVNEASFHEFSFCSVLEVSF